LDHWIQYGAMALALTALILNWRGMKKYVPVGLFASFYANAWCAVAISFKWWEYHVRIVPAMDDISVPVNFVVVPVLAMFWVRYMPLRLKEQLLWALIWTAPLTGVELLLERHTGVIKYHNGYEWYFSFLLWYLSWFIWYWFHLWLNGGRREFDSLFR